MYDAVIIGCGRIAGYSQNGNIDNFTHGYAYMNNPEVQLVGCMDIDIEKGKAFANRYNCDHFEDIKTLIKSVQPHIVSVCTPDDTHFKITKTLLKMGENIRVIFLEKPACNTLDDMEMLIKLSADKNIDIVVNYTRRFDNRYVEIRKNITNGIFGSLVNGVVTYYSGWHHNGGHVIDTLSFIFNDTIIIDKISNSFESPYRDDPTIEGKLTFSKLPGMIHLFSFDEKFYQLFEFDLRFEKSRLRIEDFGSRILLENKIVNNIGENVLVMEDNPFNKDETTAIQNALSIIVKQLNESNPDLLNGYRLEDVTETMRTIWKGMSVYEN